MALVYQDAHGALWQGDCRQVLPTLPAESVGLIVTSPPYNVGWDYGDGEDGDRLELDEYLDGLLAPVFRECARVLRQGGVAVINLPSTINTATERAFPIGAWAELAVRATGLLMRPPIIWVKSQPGATIYAVGTAIGNYKNPALRFCHERLIVAQKGQYQIPDREPRWPGEASAFGSYLELCKDVWLIKPGRAQPGQPLAFPDELVSRLVYLFSNPGDVVLDPFAGNGVTPRVAKTLGRVGWAVELRERYVPRLEAVVGQGRLAWDAPAPLAATP